MNIEGSAGRQSFGMPETPDRPQHGNDAVDHHPDPLPEVSLISTTPPSTEVPTDDMLGLDGRHGETEAASSFQQYDDMPGLDKPLATAGTAASADKETVFASPIDLTRVDEPAQSSPGEAPNDSPNVSLDSVSNEVVKPPVVAPTEQSVEIALVAQPEIVPPPTRSLKQITQVNKPVETGNPDDNKDAYKRPNENKVRSVLIAGGTSEARYERGPEIDGIVAPWRLVVSEELVNEVATSRDLPSNDAGNEPPLPSPQHAAWTRLARSRTPMDPDNTGAADNTGGLGGMDVAKLNTYRGSVTFINRATGLPRPEHTDIIDEAQYDAVGAAERHEREAPKLIRASNDLSTGEGELVRQDVLVGAPDEETLRNIAHTAASVMLPNPAYNWVPETDPETKELKIYPTAAAAVAAQELPEHDSIVSATQFVRTISYPEKPEPGIRQGTWYDTFGAEMTCPEGVPAIHIGQVEKNGAPSSVASLPIEGFKRHFKVMANSGFGKSAFIATVAEGLTVANADRTAAAAAAGEEPPEHTTTLLFDNETGSLPWEIATRFAAREDLPDSHKKVLVIHFGKDEVRCLVPLANPKYNSDDKIIDNVSDIAATASERNGNNGSDASSIRRFVGLGIEEAIKQGHYTVAGVLKAIPEGLKKSDQKFPPEVEAHIDAYARGQGQADFVRGVAGDALGKFGFDLDLDAMLAHPGVIVVITDQLSPRTSKAVTAGLAKMLYDRLEYRELEGIGGKTPFPRLEMIFDEPGELISDDPASRPITDLFKLARKRDIGLGAGFQMADEAANKVLGNTELTVAFHNGLEENRKIIQGCVGDRASDAEIDWLVSPEAKPGQAIVYKGDKKVIVKINDPNTIDRAEPHIVRNGEGIIDLGIFEKAVPKDIIDDALEFMERQEIGQRLHAVVEKNATLGAEGHALTAVDGVHLHDLQSMTGRQAEIRDAEIQIAVTDRKLPRIVATRLLNQVRRIETAFDDQPILELAKPQTYYNHVLAKIDEHLVPPRLEDTPKYEAAFGEEIYGLDGGDQLKRVTLLKKSAVETVIAGIKTDELDGKAVLAAIRLGGAWSEERTSATKQSIASTIKRALTPQEEAKIDILASKIRQQMAEKGTQALTYDDMIGTIEKEFKARENTPALPLSKEKITYKEDFPAPETGLAREQRQIIETRARIRAANATQEYGPAEQSAVAFAHHPRSQGFTLNRIVGALATKSSGAQGPIHDYQRALLGIKSPDILTALNEGNTSVASTWTRIFKTIIGADAKQDETGYYRDNYSIMTPGAHKALVRIYNPQIQGLQGTAQDAKKDQPAQKTPTKKES